MSFTWTPYALPGLFAALLGWSLAWFVYRSRPDRQQNRRLALQLAMEALVIGIVGGGVWLINDARMIMALSVTALMAVWPKLWTYYSFLATLDTPLARPLQSRTRLNWFLALTLAASTTVLIWPDWYHGPVAPWPAVQALALAPGTGFVRLFWMWSVMWLVGLSFSISAYRQAKTTMRRDQARMFLIAFGTRDICFGLTVAGLTNVPPSHPLYHWVYLSIPLIWVIYCPLVAYGILRYQLFDIDLRIKRTVQRSGILTAFAAAFFVGSQWLEQVIPVHGFLLGLIASAAVAAAFKPLQRAAAAFADRVMPGVGSSGDYLTERKHVVYREAVEGACADGTISERERAILQKLRQSLEIDTAMAARIEAEVQQQLSAPAGVAQVALA